MSWFRNLLDWFRKMLAVGVGVSPILIGSSPASILDSTPDQFTFVDYTNINQSQLQFSITITVAGMTVGETVTATLTGDSSSRMSIDTGSGFGAFLAGPFTGVKAGDRIIVRHMSSATVSTAVSSTLTIGTVSDTFTTTTLAGVGGYGVTAPALTLNASDPLDWDISTVDANGAIEGDTLRMRFKINGGSYTNVDEVLDDPELVTGVDTFPPTDFGTYANGDIVKWNVCVFRGGNQVSDWSNELTWNAIALTYPASLFGSLGATIGWAIDPSDPATLFNTITGTGAVTDTTLVGTVKDQSGLGWDFVANANDSTRPTWDDANNALVFDGSNDALFTGHAGLYANQGATFVFAVLVVAGQTSKYFFDEGNSGTTNQFYAPGTAVGTTANYDMVFIRKDDGTNIVQDTTSPAVFDGSFHVMTITDTGSQIKVYKDRTLVKTTNYTYVANTLNRSGLGALVRSTFGSWCNCKISRAAAVPSVLTGSNLSTLENWAATAVGITLP